MAIVVVLPNQQITMVFTRGEGILVTTHGPGHLHLYSYGSNSGLPGIFGTVQTTRSGVSHFVISHSYTFTKYAFYWGGKGEAEYCVGQDPKQHRVGSSWGTASWVTYGGRPTTLDVSPEYFRGALNRDNEVTCFLLPESLPHTSIAS